MTPSSQLVWIARTGVDAGIALDRKSGAPITLYSVALQSQRAASPAAA